MTPKFRGDENDWLDDEDHNNAQAGGRPAATKKKKPMQDYLDPALANATVAEVFPNQCLILTDEGERLPATYRKAKLPQLESRDRAPVAVGDRVLHERVSTTDAVIDGVCARRNEIVRPAPARATRHVLTANLDLLVIVAASLDPDFSPGLIDRFLIAAQAQEISAVIVVTKMDLWQAQPDFVSITPPWQLYRDLGIEVFELGAKIGAGVDELHARVKEKLTAFCGHSGVGKTSLLNAIVGHQVGRIGEVNVFTGKGQHTTTGAYLIPDTKLIDTPGIRAFGLIGIEPDRLSDYFAEFTGAPCGSAGCLHRHETDCAVKEFPRYPNYRRILESLIAEEG